MKIQKSHVKSRTFFGCVSSYRAVCDRATPPTIKKLQSKDVATVYCSCVWISRAVVHDRLRTLTVHCVRAMWVYIIRSQVSKLHEHSNSTVFLVAMSADLEAYSEDIRLRVVKHISMHIKFETIARNLNIATSTTHRIYLLFERTGSVDSQTSKRSTWELWVL